MLTGRTVSVIGGGIAGLSAAYFLRQLLPDVEISLFEQSGRTGGRIATERVDGFLVEAGPDGFVTHKPAALEWAHRLGLADQVIHSPPSLGAAYVRRGASLHRLPDGLSGLVPARLGPLFRSRVLSIRGRLRVAAEHWIPARPTDDESLDRFLTRRFGKEAARNLFEPLFGGIYGRTEALSARTTVPQLLDLEREYGSVLRGLRARKREEGTQQKLASFAEGMSVLPDRARVVLESSGVRIETGRGICGLRVEQGRCVLLSGGGGEDLHADAVIIALPVSAASGLVGQVAPGAAEILSGIGTTSSAVVALGVSEASITRRLDASGYVVAGPHARPTTACTWSSAKFRDRAPAGSSLFRVFFGGAEYEAGPPDDSDLIEMATDELRESVGMTGMPDLVRVYRHHSATPHLAVGHVDRMNRLDAALGDIPAPLALAGNYHSGVGIADAIAAGRSAALRITDRLRKVE